MHIIRPSTPEQIEAFRGLLREWFDHLVHDHGIDMGYQSIEAEMAGLPGYYGPPRGGIWLAYDDAGATVDADQARGAESGRDAEDMRRAGGAVGCVALRPMTDAGVCELKRLYVRPAHRGVGVGRALTVQAIDEARAMGYRLMRLDTGTFLDASQRLYASLGFVERGPYYKVPPDVLRVTVFMELRVAGADRPRCRPERPSPVASPPRS